jgi:hypothetical protein
MPRKAVRPWLRHHNALRPSTGPLEIVLPWKLDPEISNGELPKSKPSGALHEAAMQI